MPTPANTDAAADNAKEQAPSNTTATPRVAATPAPNTPVRTKIEHTFQQTAADIATPAAAPPRPPNTAAAPVAINLRTQTAGSLDEFIEYWRDAVGFSMSVTRESDPIQKRIAGQGYRRPAPAAESIGAFPFTPKVAEFISDLQTVNGNSGGSFTVHLYDAESELVITYDAAGVWRGNISDPPFTAPKEVTREREPKQDRFTAKAVALFDKKIDALLEGKDSGEESNENKMSKDIQSATVPLATAAIISTTSEAMKAAIAAAQSISNNGGGEEKSVKTLIAERVLDDKDLQDKVIAGVGVAAQGVATFFGTLLGGRRRQQDTPAAVDTPAAAVSNPVSQPATETEPTDTNTQAPFDELGYVLQACAANRPIDPLEDEGMLRFKKTQPLNYAKFIGGLKLLSLEGIKEEILRISREAGRGAEVEGVFALPHADNFILYMQRKAKGQ